MHGTCQSSTSWVQYSPKCRLSPGVDSVSVDLELAPEAGVCCLSGVLGHCTKARWGNSEVPGTVVPPRPHCGEAQVSFRLVSRTWSRSHPLPQVDGQECPSSRSGHKQASLWPAYSATSSPPSGALRHRSETPTSSMSCSITGDVHVLPPIKIPGSCHNAGAQSWTPGRWRGQADGQPREGQTEILRQGEKGEFPIRLWWPGGREETEATLDSGVRSPDGSQG